MNAPNATTGAPETLPTSIPTPEVPPPLSPVLSFIIGLSIILAASILNAGGLNLTKLDHVRTRALPKASRRRDFLRPLWLLGMLLYILSQVIGSTLALEYMRAEFVAPLGSSSLVFNFLFASLLVGTPVTRNDIYGTIVVIIGVIGIVAFGSVNSGISTDFDPDRLHNLWVRGGWLAYFILVGCLPIIIVYVFATQLEDILANRSDISAVPFAGSGGAGQRGTAPPTGVWTKAKGMYFGFLAFVRDRIDGWTEAQDDKSLSWTLGVVWACVGGALAGGCLVFAKVCVSLVSGSIKHRVERNQFAHPAAIVTFIFLALTAVFQIICLNRGLKVYDSTLVVPVFYGIYTASGFLNSLIFNNEVDAYANWTLFLIFCSISILIIGVVLLTNKKPAPTGSSSTRNTPSVGAVPLRDRIRRRGSAKTRGSEDEDEQGERTGLRGDDVGDEEEVMWTVGDASDDEDEAGTGGASSGKVKSPVLTSPRRARFHGEEGRGLMREPGAEENDDDVETDDVPRLPPAPRRRSSRAQETMDDWEDAAKP